MILKTEVKKVASPEEVARIMREILSAESQIDQDKEHVWVVGLTVANTIKYIELVSLGTLDKSVVSPREVFRHAISAGVKSIILVHNHPSGEVVPSKEDEVLTKRLVEAGKVIWIEVLDHIILGQYSFYSFKEAMEI